MKRNGRYEPISHDTLAERVRRTALGLEELGVRSGDRVAILSENRPEWAIADYACLMLGVADVPIYPNLPSDQVAYILRDSGAVAIFVSNAEQAAKIAPIRGECPALRHVITFADTAAGADLTLASLETPGAAVDNEARRGAYTRPRDRPCARRSGDAHLHLRHDRRAEGRDADARQHLLERDGGVERRFRSRASTSCLSFLPLSHIFERMAGHYLMFATGTSIAYAESIDTVPLNLTEVRPTLVLSVPRLYEKMYARVLENALSGGGAEEADLLLGARRRGSLGRRQAGGRHAGRPARAAVPDRAEVSIL